MKVFLPILLLIGLPFLLKAEEATWSYPYPEVYPGKDLNTFIEELGKPNIRKQGTGSEHQTVTHIAGDLLVSEPTLPPKFAHGDEVLYCSWKDAPREMKNVWFRRVDGKWMSFWNCAPSRISCGVRISVEF